MKSAREALFTCNGGHGECNRLRLTAKVGQNSLFAILACPSANRPDILWEPGTCTGRTPDASNTAA